jgi:hypothetical protein
MRAGLINVLSFLRGARCRYKTGGGILTLRELLRGHVLAIDTMKMGWSDR